MTTMTTKAILKQYNVAKVRTMKPITSGLIHSSYKVESTSGTYLLQRLNPTLENHSMARNYFVITEYLARRGHLTQVIIRNVRGELLTREGKNLWRLLTFVPGQVFENAPTSKQAYQAGRALGIFHRQLRGFRGRLEGKVLIHDTEDVLKKFAKLPRTREQAQVYTSLRLALLPSGLPQTIIHGDPKLTNIVFPKTGDPVFVDLDTVRKGSVLLDLGDALRSWCKKTTERGITVDHRIFRQALQGYKDGRGTWKLSKREQRLIVQAYSLITFELAARFLVDAVEQKLFVWDKKLFPSLEKQNQMRAQKMLQLAGEIERHRPKLEAIVREIFS